MRAFFELVRRMRPGRWETARNVSVGGGLCAIVRCLSGQRRKALTIFLQSISNASTFPASLGRLPPILPWRTPVGILSRVFVAPWAFLRTRHSAGSPLADHVVHVVLDCAKEQMGWVNAHRVIASVEHPDVVNQRSNVNHPRDTMRHVWAIIDAELTVAAPILRSRPNPASIVGGLLDERIESSFERSVVRIIGSHDVPPPGRTLWLGLVGRSNGPISPFILPQLAAQ